MLNTKLQKEPIINQSGYFPKESAITVIKPKHYKVIREYAITGDAPKEFLKVYKYGEARRSNPAKWELYITKTGHKWYPNESITEYLFNRIGEVWGFNMVKSKLRIITGQIRFLSKYFLKKGQLLEHGADIYAGYLSDERFVQEIEQKGYARTFFTLQFTREALSVIYPEHHKTLFSNFIIMVLFDAIVGNNDRHYYNWGIIKSIKKEHNPVFAPIYDTARGLFWNYSEEKILNLYNASNYEHRLEKYIDNSRPKIGWENEQNINHINLVKFIIENEYSLSNATFHQILSVDLLNNCLRMIDDEFNELLSHERLKVIKDSLIIRFKKLKALGQ